MFSQRRRMWTLLFRRRSTHWTQGRLPLHSHENCKGHPPKKSLAAAAAESSFCGIPSTAAAESSICGIPSTAAAESSICGIPSTVAAESSFCGVPSTAAAESSFCGPHPPKSSTEASVLPKGRRLRILLYRPSSTHWPPRLNPTVQHLAQRPENADSPIPYSIDAPDPNAQPHHNATASEP